MIRKFIEFAIDKPLLNHILLIFILVLSLFAYANIPKEIFPPMAMDKISISGGYVGTSADVLDKISFFTSQPKILSVCMLQSIKPSWSFIIIAS